jgi:hypothetical protein
MVPTLKVSYLRQNNADPSWFGDGCAAFILHRVVYLGLKVPLLLALAGPW